MHLGIIHVVAPYRYLFEANYAITSVKKIISAPIILMLLVCTNTIFATEVTGSFGVPMSAGDPNEDPTKDRVEALYNQIGVAGGGINLFTGDASLSIPIDILNLTYGGNVYKILASPNDRIQSSWVGTGWTLTMGYISAVQNNTVELGDDTYYIVTEDGVSGELKQIGGTGNEFYFEDYKYWKIERITSGQKIKQWIVTKEDGTIYKYGDNNTGIGPNKGNRCALCWGNWIGNGTTISGIDQVPYQWDLTGIYDTYGNRVINIEYEQTNVYFQTVVPYTKASYLKKITDRSGREIEFILKDRDPSEWVDSYPEYDNLLERYETKKLDNISIKGPDGNVVAKYEFNHVVAESGPESGRGKQFLLSITQKDQNENVLPSYKFDYAELEGPDNDGNYTAHSDSAFRGSIEQVTYPSGGSTTFEYSFEANTTEIKQNNMQVLTDVISLPAYSRQVYMTDEHFLAIDDLNCAPSNASIPAPWSGPAYLRAWHWNGYSWEKPVPANDFYYEQDPWFSADNILYGEWDSGEILLNYSQQVGHSWAYSPVLAGYGDKIALVTFKDGQSFPNVEDQLITWHWTGNKWVKGMVDESIIYDILGEPSTEPLLAMTEDKMAVLYQKEKQMSPGEAVDNGILRVYAWDGSNWGEGFNLADVNYRSTQKGLYAGNGLNLKLTDNHLLVTEMSVDYDGIEPLECTIWNWNGSVWVEKDLPKFGNGGYISTDFEALDPKISLTNDKLAIISYNGDGVSVGGTATLRVWHWDGHDWISKTNTIEGDTIFAQDNVLNPILLVQDDKMLVIEEKREYIGPGQLMSLAEMHIWHWDGSVYKEDSFEIDSDYPITHMFYDEFDHRDPKVQFLGDKVIIFQPEINFVTHKREASLRSWQLNKSTTPWVWDEYDYTGNPLPASFIRRGFLWDMRQTASIDLIAQTGNSQDLIVVLSDDELGDDYMDLRAWRWTGDKWEMTLNLENENSFGDVSDYSLYAHETRLFTMGDRLFVTDGVNNSTYVPYENHDDIPRDSLICFMNFNETWSGIEDEGIGDVRVTSKTTNDMIGTEVTTSIDYKNGVYNLNSETAQYNEVIVTIPDGNGTTETYFYNDLDQNEAIDFQPVESDLSGDEEHYKELDGKPYKIVNRNNAGTEVSSTINTYSLHDIDSNNNIYHKRLVETTNTIDGIATTESYQYNNGNGMVNKKTETNTDGTQRITETKYAFEDSFYPDMKNAHMLSPVAMQKVKEDNFTKSAIAATYKDWAVNGVNWAPVKSYAWLDNDEASTDPPTFNFDIWSDSGEPPNTSEWIRQSKITQRDSYGNVIEALDANGTPSSTIYEYKGTLPVSQSANAGIGEMGYTSFENHEAHGWSHTEQIAQITHAHTGNLVVKVGTFNGHQYGPTMDFKQSDGLIADTGFEASVWAKGPSTAYLTIKVNNSNPENRVFCSGSGEWELLHVCLTKEQIQSSMNGDDFIRVFVGNTSSDTAYFDDIRFYPSDALMTTQTYDPVSLAVTSVSNENNIPVFTDYDHFNRPMSTSNSEDGMLNYSTYFYSRNGNNNDEYNQSSPNYVENASFPNGNFAPNWSFEEFDEQGYPLDWEGYYSGSVSVVDMVDNQGLFPKFGSHVLMVNDQSIDNKTDGAQFNFYDYEDNEYSQLIGESVTFSAYVRTEGCEMNIRIGIENNEPSQFDFITTDWKKIEIKIPSLKSQKHFNLGLRLRCYIVSEAGEAETFYIDGVVLEKGPGSDPMVTRTYFDGLGREIQSQIWDRDAELTNLSQYNPIGKVDKTYKAKLYKNSTFPHLFSNISTNNNLYESFMYENNPLARIEKQIHADSHFILYNYDNETNNNSNFRYEQVTDEEGKISKSYFDKFGNSVGGVGGYTNTSDADLIEWSQKYDILGNLTVNEPPNAHRTGTINENWNSQYTYNTLGQMVSRETPDEGLTNFKYDPKGNVILSQNAYQSEHGKFTVNYYDAHDRLVLTGEENNVWPLDLAQYYNRGYLTGANEWKIRYTYDKDQFSGDIVTNYCKNKLSMVEVNTDGSMDSDHIYKYVYDSFGNITEKHIWLNKGYKIHNERILYEYDALGRKILVQYPSGRTLYYNYDNAGRLKNIVSLADLKEVVQLDVKVFLEGPYDPNTMQMTTTLSDAKLIPLSSPYSEDMKTLERIPSTMTDWVLVELLTQPSGAVVDSRSAILLKDGKITAEDGSSPVQLFASNGDLLYVRIKHRNHMTVISATPIEVQSNNVAHYDFTQSASQYYNYYGMTELETNQYAMLAGDTDQSLSIGASDRAATQINVFDAGYNPADCNLDSRIDQLDRGLTLKNSQEIIPVE